MDATAPLRDGSAQIDISVAATVPHRFAPTPQTGPSQAYPVDTTPIISQLLQSFAQDGEAIQVCFRDLVSWIKVGERATHYLHPYPAKLLPHIAHFFLASRAFAGREDSVLDPFAGTGTVALETILSGRRALHADVNPLASLITTVKTRVVNDQEIVSAAAHLRDAFRRSRTRARPDVVNLDRWYAVATARRLGRLRSVIEQVRSSDMREFLQITFSAVARKASRADPRFSVPVRRRESEVELEPDVWRLFEQQLEANRNRMRALGLMFIGAPGIECVGDDARSLRDLTGCPLRDGSVGMVLTSPPYAGAQKYVRAASLSLGWLGMAGAGDLTALERRTIGREHLPRHTTAEQIPTGIVEADQLLARIFDRNPLRAAIAARYLVEMRAALAETERVLRPGGYLVLVIGDNTVCGESFASSRYLRTMLEALGLETRLVLVDPIRSRGLLTRRAPTAGVIACEWVIVFQKSGVSA